VSAIKSLLQPYPKPSSPAPSYRRHSRAHVLLPPLPLPLEHNAASHSFLLPSSPSTLPQTSSMIRRSTLVKIFLFPVHVRYLLAFAMR
jgi:hypothetical protein